ncbi:restriction endonuclease subunit S [Brachybacterium epidermidis]|uniref:restriction endonuclease subunit S n=1 Tax=Brachybacterium epidermidis TaxID=2781983 RepID=UPI00398E5BD9
MRDGWQRVTLGDVAHTVKPSSTVSGQRYVGLEHFTPRSPRITSWGSTDDVLSGSTAFEPGDVLFSKLRPYLHKVAVADFAGRCTNEALVYRATPRISTDFLGLVLQTDQAIAFADRSSAGSRMPRTSSKAMSTFEIALPSLREQERIVDLIATLDSTIQNAETEAVALGTATTLAVKARIASRSAHVGTLGDLAVWYSGATPKATNPAFYEGGTIPWAVIADVQDKPISDTARHITESGLKTIGRQAPPGSVLLTMYGTIGRTALVKKAMATNQAITWGVPKPDVSSEFLFAYLRTVSSDLDALGRGATQRNINREIVRGFPAPILDRSDQEAVADLFSSLAASHEAAQGTLRSLHALRANLLTVLLSGEHEIPESYDELVGAAS